MTFTKTVAAILLDQEEIPGLAPNQLFTVRKDGEVLNRVFSLEFLIKIARLQTLTCRERESNDIPEGNTLNSHTSAAQIFEDGLWRVMLLERLIVEAIHEEVPTECEKFNVLYALTKDHKIVRYSVPSILQLG